jgi:hypothetical protein
MSMLVLGGHGAWTAAFAGDCDAAAIVDALSGAGCVC